MEIATKITKQSQDAVAKVRELQKRYGENVADLIEQIRGGKLRIGGRRAWR